METSAAKLAMRLAAIACTVLLAACSKTVQWEEVLFNAGEDNLG